MVAGDEVQCSVGEASVRALITDVEYVLAQPQSDRSALAAQVLTHHSPPIVEALIAPGFAESQRRCRLLMDAVAGGQTVSSSYGLAFIHQRDRPPLEAAAVAPPVRPAPAAHAAPPPPLSRVGALPPMSPTFQKPPPPAARSSFDFPAVDLPLGSRGPWWKRRWVWVAVGLLAVAGVAQAAIESGGQHVAAEGAASMQPFAGFVEQSTTELPATALPPSTAAPTTVAPTTVVPTTVAPATVPPKTEAPITTSPPATVAPTTVPVAQCDPNYSGCVPIASDVDCAGGSGNGPAYVRGPVQVIGRDIYGLDRDSDGVGCE